MRVRVLVLVLVLDLNLLLLVSTMAQVHLFWWLLKRRSFDRNLHRIGFDHFGRVLWAHSRNL